jgi:hypothetical protein
MPTHGSTCHESPHEDLDGTGNVALAGLPSADGPPALDLHQTGEAFGAQTEGMTGGSEFGGRQAIQPLIFASIQNTAQNAMIPAP